MKIAITGGAGFIGSHLARIYLDAGHDVLIIDNLTYGNRQAVDPRARLYTVDIRDSKLRTILQQERPDVVSHHAVHYPDTITGERSLADADVHIRGLLNILEGCVNAGVDKMIFASGGNSLYGHVDVDQLPVTETAALYPRQLDAISKVAGEWYVRYYTNQFGLKHTILRYADVYGETDIAHAHHPMTHFIAMLLQNQRPIIRGTGEEIRDHIFIDDIVEANIRALKRGENQTLHISSGRGYSENQLCEMLITLLHRNLDAVHISGTFTEDYSIVMDNSRAQRVLGWRPEIPMMEGMQRALDLWYTPKETGSLQQEMTPHRVTEAMRVIS
ncbi:MAG: NAD-dependent epimerase/dehydratase family protein [Ktedonobacteraceae bacterium]|nr:NAD-dependent epimerase/dehydratase family protein [Ktedonobacteraceae bacterium]